MVLSPVDTTLESDGTTDLFYNYRGTDPNQNAQDTQDTVQAFASAALNVASPRVITDTGLNDDNLGFYITYGPASFATAFTGSLEKTQALALANSLSNFNAVFVQPAAGFVAGVASDLANTAAGFGSKLISILPYAIGTVIAFKVYDEFFNGRSFKSKEKKTEAK